MEKILIVDDLAANARALAMLLRASGYHVATAESGVAALSVLNQGNIGLVLLDLMMPGMNGLDVLRIMQSDPRLHGLPVVVFSATDAYRDEALELGARNFVVKGKVETLAELHEAIQKEMLNN